MGTSVSKRELKEQNELLTDQLRAEQLKRMRAVYSTLQSVHKMSSPKKNVLLVALQNANDALGLDRDHGLMDVDGNYKTIADLQKEAPAKLRAMLDRVPGLAFEPDLLTEQPAHK